MDFSVLGFKLESTIDWFFVFWCGFYFLSSGVLNKISLRSRPGVVLKAAKS